MKVGDHTIAWHSAGNEWLVCDISQRVVGRFPTLYEAEQFVIDPWTCSTHGPIEPIGETDCPQCEQES